MNEELKNKVNEFLIETLQEVSNAKDFIKAEIPEVVSELLLYNFWITIIPFCIGVILLITMFIIFWKKYDKIKELMEDDYMIPFALSLLFGAVLGILIMIIIGNFDWFQITIAPKLYIIEYMRGLK